MAINIYQVDSLFGQNMSGITRTELFQRMTRRTRYFFNGLLHTAFPRQKYCIDDDSCWPWSCGL